MTLYGNPPATIEGGTAVKTEYPLRRGEWAVNRLMENIALWFPEMAVIVGNAQAMGVATPKAAICRYAIAVHVRQFDYVIQAGWYKGKGVRMDDRDIWEIGTWWYERKGVI